MRQVISILGILLIVLGIVTLGYQGITYTKQEKVAQIGPVEITAEKEHEIYFPPILGGLALVAGVVLIVVGRRY